MRQVFLKNGQTKLFNINIPLYNSNSILVKTEYSFISSGTELATISASNKSPLKQTSSNFNQNIKKVISSIKDNGLFSTFKLIQEKLNQVTPLGYSCSGKIVAVGKNVKNFCIGDLVACAGTEYANHAEVVVVPENLAVKINKPETLKEVSITTIGAIALQGVRRADLVLGEKVCIIGLGLIGQLTLQLAKLSGCQVIGIDIQENRLKLASDLGADFVFNSTNCNFINEIEWITEKRGVDATIITAASESGQLIQQAMQITRRKGRVVLVGDVKIDFDRDPFYSKEINFLISCSYGPGRYDDSYEKQGIDYPYEYVRWTENRNMELFAKLVQQKKILIDPLISQEFNFKNIEAAYQTLQTGSSLGTIISYKSDVDAEIKEALNKNTFKLEIVKKFEACKETINIGCIGVGGFARVKLLPIISKIKNIKIHSIIDTNPTNLINLSNQYKIDNFSNNYKDLLENDLIKAVVIATPHHLHTEQSLEFISSGKAVFVEKPAAVNFEQLKKLKHFFAQNKEILYCVDFNRTFSPFMKRIKKFTSKRTNPMIIHYRMNAGLIPQNHWIYSDENKGRIIGEACHIFELFCFLTDATPISISAQSISPQNKILKSTDNFVAQLRMSDGSCCSLLYTSIGDLKSGKEYMEIFFDGKSIIMNDFYEIRGFGLPSSFTQKSKIQEKGHSILLKEFFNESKKTQYKPPIPLDRILISTEISLIINKLVQDGGGTIVF